MLEKGNTLLQMKSLNTKIETYLSSSSRNKLIIHSKFIEDIEYLDIGYMLAKYLSAQKLDKRIALRTLDYLEELFRKNIHTHPSIGKYLGLSNLGILLEPTLKIDLKPFLEKHSKSLTLIIKWDGELHNGCMYHKTKEKGLKIELTDISYLLL